MVGVSSLLPGSRDARGFWRDVVAGRDLLTEVPSSHWLISDYYDPDPTAPDRTYARRGAFLTPVPYDPLGFGTPPATLSATDTAQLLAVPVAEGALRDAVGDDPSRFDRERAGVIVGTGALELLLHMACRLQRPVWLDSLRAEGVDEPLAQRICERIEAHYVPWQEATFPGLLANVVAGRIANRLDLHGINCVIDAACASSLAALSAAVNELELGRVDLMLVGGVDTFNDITMFMCFSKTPALSPSGDCRPFSDRADGTMLGEGLVFFALKRLADAERDGDRVYAVLRGLGASSDGQGAAIYAPQPSGQARALRRAYAMAGYDPRTVELVEAHGTGTPAGDAAEVAALTEVFGSAQRPWCALGSAKSQFGHTKSAAGAVGLLKAVLALHHRVLPPTIKVDRPASALESPSGPMYVNTRARPWVRDGAHPRRASVSSFGFGGSNYHATLEEYVPRGDGRRAERLSVVPTELVLRSADTEAGLGAASTFSVTDHAREAVVRSEAGVIWSHRRLGPFGPPGLSDPLGLSDPPGSSASGRVAFLFCGQGAQYPDMGADLAMAFPAALDAWDKLATEPFDGGVPLHEVVFPRPAFSDDERLRQRQMLTATEWAQPALAALCVAQLRLADELGLRADCVAGHSLGELVALHAAGCYDALALIRLARRRGELMRDASDASDEPGAMLAVAAGVEQVTALIADRPDVWIANINSARQTVLSGTVAGIEEIARLADEGVDGGVDEGAGAGVGAMATRRLATSTGFHSPLVAPASPQLHKYLQDIDVSGPVIPVYANRDAGRYPDDPAEIRDRIAAQLSEPVHFADQIEAMYADGVRTFVEFGAGDALSSLVGQILGGREHLAVALDRRGGHGVTALQQAVGRLAVHGVPVNVQMLEARTPRAADAGDGFGERARSGVTVELGGSNYAKPYPPPGGETEIAMPNHPSEGTESWLLALQEIQRQTSEAHAAYQHALADGHGAYLRTSEATLSGMLAALDGTRPLPVDRSNRASAANGTPAAAPTSARAPSLAAPDFAPAPVEIPRPAQRLEIPRPVASEPPPVERGRPQQDPQEVEGVVISIVAELTGYPVDVLNPDMELEHDLGIDSIKRVQILSRVRDRVPDLPRLEPGELAALRTIGEISTYLRRHGTGRQSSPSTDAEGVSSAPMR